MFYLIKAGFYDGDECYTDDSREQSAESLEEALPLLHNTWFPDMRADYFEGWDAFCYADAPTCWKSISLVDDSGNVLHEVESTEGDELRIYDVAQQFQEFGF